MEHENYYLSNLETGKLNIHTNKAFYDSLEDDKKKVIKRYCLWSNKQQCWISKGKSDNCFYLKSSLREMGFQDNGSFGQQIPFEQQVANLQQKAGLRAERSEARAEKATQQSDILYTQAKKMASIIPFGQPILVGHHSESRDRSYRNQISNKFDKAFKEQDKADYYTEKAATAKETAAGKQYSNPVFLATRIKECEKLIRVLERRLLGKFYVHSPVREISEEGKVFYNKRLSEVQDKLNFYSKCMKEVYPEYTGKLEIKTKKIKGKSKGL